MPRSRFLKHQNLDVNFQEGLNLWDPLPGFRPCRIPRTGPPDLLAPFVEILNTPLNSDSESDAETACELFIITRFVCDADRYIIIGNHYDAFVLGALDPNSGTAIMLELSRAFALLRKQGQLSLSGVH